MQTGDASRVFPAEVETDLFAGFPVRDFDVSLSWYSRLLGCSPAFFPTGTEAVWELSEHRYIFIRVHPEGAGHSYSLVFLSDLDGFRSRAAERGIEPAVQETLADGTRKAVYLDPDRNEVGFGSHR